MLYKRSFLAGIVFAISTAISLLTPSQIMGWSLFSLGMALVMYYQLWLFTGKVNFHSWRSDFKESLIVLAFNVLGAMAAGGLISVACPSVVPTALCQVEELLSLNVIQVLISGVGCGILSYIALITANSYTGEHSCIGLTVLIMCCAGFMACGFTHCIVLASQLAMAGACMTLDQILKTLLYLLVVVIGNSLGSILFYQLHYSPQTTE